MNKLFQKVRKKPHLILLFGLKRTCAWNCSTVLIGPSVVYKLPNLMVFCYCSLHGLRHCQAPTLCSLKGSTGEPHPWNPLGTTTSPESQNCLRTHHPLCCSSWDSGHCPSCQQVALPSVQRTRRACKGLPSASPTSSPGDWAPAHVTQQAPRGSAGSGSMISWGRCSRG